MENLTTESKESKEPQPLFKVGDRVKILPPRDKSNYKYGYNDKMQALEGQTAVITSCNKYSGCKSFSDDGYVYKINIGSTGFNWSSQSFVKLEELQQAVLQSAQCDVTSVQVDGSLLTTYPIQCGKLSIFDCLSDDRSAKEEKEEKKEKYKLNFKIK